MVDHRNLLTSGKKYQKLRSWSTGRTGRNMLE